MEISKGDNFLFNFKPAHIIQWDFIMFFMLRCRQIDSVHGWSRLVRDFTRFLGTGVAEVLPFFQNFRNSGAVFSRSNYDSNEMHSTKNQN